MMWPFRATHDRLDDKSILRAHAANELRDALDNLLKKDKIARELGLSPRYSVTTAWLSSERFDPSLGKWRVEVLCYNLEKF